MKDEGQRERIEQKPAAAGAAMEGALPCNQNRTRPKRPGRGGRVPTPSRNPRTAVREPRSQQFYEFLRKSLRRGVSCCILVVQVMGTKLRERLKDDKRCREFAH